MTVPASGPPSATPRARWAWLALWLALVAALAAAPRWATGDVVDGASWHAYRLRDDAFARLAAALAEAGTGDPTWRAELVRDGDATLVVVSAASGTERAASAELVGAATVPPRERRSPSFGVRAHLRGADPGADRVLDRAVGAVVGADRGGAHERPARQPHRPPLPHSFSLAALAALGAGFVLLLRDRAPPRVASAPEVKLGHVLPTVLQTAIFAYWSLYWPPVGAHLGLLVVQVTFAYVLELLLAWGLRRTWVPGLGPLPIVLSANLFLWFSGFDTWLYLWVVGCAVASKALIHRGGRHIFNPSAFGASAVALAVIVAPGHLSFNDLSVQLAFPPNMLELMFVLALIPHLRVGTITVTVGAALASELLSQQGWLWHVPSIFWPAWFLSMTLLAGDPATIPRTHLGRLLFGIFVGTGIDVSAWALVEFTGTDYFAKVVAIPPANWLAPRFDAFAEKLQELAEQRLDRILARPSLVAGAVLLGVLFAPAVLCLLVLFAPRGRRGWAWLADRTVPALVGLWAVWFLLGMAGSGKRSTFNGAAQAEHRTRFVQFPGSDAPARCEDNPVFCTPFSVGSEIALWTGRGAGPGER